MIEYQILQILKYVDDNKSKLAAGNCKRSKCTVIFYFGNFKYYFRYKNINQKNKDNFGKIVKEKIKGIEQYITHNFDFK